MDEYGSLGDAIKNIYGEELSVKEMLPVSGGDINNAYACCLSDGSRLFMKSNKKGGPTPRNEEQQLRSKSKS